VFIQIGEKSVGGFLTVLGIVARLRLLAFSARAFSPAARCAERIGFGNRFGGWPRRLVQVPRRFLAIIRGRRDVLDASFSWTILGL